MATIAPPRPTDVESVDPTRSEVERGGDEDPMPRPFRPVELVPVGILGVLAPVVLLRMVPFSRPVVYAQDMFQHLALARTANWFGTPGATGALNAPDGLDWFRNLPTGTERIHVIVLKLADTLSGADPWLTLNLAVVVGVAATIVVSYLVIRWFGAGPLLAGAASVAFAFSTALTDRLGSGHLFLFPLYPVALGVYLAVLGTRWQGGRGRRALVVPAVAIAVVAMSSVYYATFTILLVVALGGFAAVRAGSWRRLGVPAVIVVALGASMAATLAPDVIARHGAATSGGFTRAVQDSDRYGMRLAQLVLPVPSTQIPVLDRVAERAYWTESVGDFGVSLGPLAVIGLAAVAWTTIRRLGRPRDPTDRTVGHLAALSGAAVLLATAGGGGLLLAAAGFTQTRVWSRMAAFIGFAALAGLALLVQRRFGRRRDLAMWVVAVLALVLAEHPLTVSAQPIERAVRQDTELVHSLESSLPRGAQVFELPVVPFPDDLGSQRLLAPSLLTDRLRFSAGEFKGGPGDWQQSWMTGDLRADTFLAAVAGFDAVVVQTSHALVAEPGNVVRDLREAAGRPVWTSDDGTWAWVDVRPLRARLVATHGRTAVDTARRAVTRPVGFTFGDWRLTTWNQGAVRQYLGPGASIDLHGGDGDRGPVEVSFRVGAPTDATVEIAAPGVEPVRVRPGAGGREVKFTVPSPAAVTRIRIRSDHDPRAFEGGTPASVWITDVRARDARGSELLDRLR